MNGTKELYFKEATIGTRIRLIKQVYTDFYLLKSVKPKVIRMKPTDSQAQTDQKLIKSVKISQISLIDVPLLLAKHATLFC